MRGAGWAYRGKGYLRGSIEDDLLNVAADRVVGAGELREPVDDLEARLEAPSGRDLDVHALVTESRLGPVEPVRQKPIAEHLVKGLSRIGARQVAVDPGKTRSLFEDQIRHWIGRPKPFVEIPDKKIRRTVVRPPTPTAHRSTR